MAVIVVAPAVKHVFGVDGAGVLVPGAHRFEDVVGRVCWAVETVPPANEAPGLVDSTGVVPPRAHHLECSLRWVGLTVVIQAPALDLAARFNPTTV